MTGSSNGNISYRWHPIEELPDDWQRLRSADLESLIPIWREQVERLRNNKALELFNQRLNRAWAIETGIIENLYSLDRGITETLIEKGIQASLIPHNNGGHTPEYIAQILYDHEDALEMIFSSVRGQRTLSVSYTKELHQAFTKHQTTTDARDPIGGLHKIPLIRGDWKQQPNNPTRKDGSIHEYCPPIHVASEMERLVALTNKYIDTKVSSEVVAAWLHHRFTQIHPFQDGNGRVARALASLVLIRSGSFPLVVDRDRRDTYIRALERADNGDLSSLAALIGSIQKEEILRGLSLSQEALDERLHFDQLLAAVIERFSRRTDRDPRYQAAFAIRDQLVRYAYGKLEGYARQLESASDASGSPYEVRLEESVAATEHYFRQQIVDTAKRLNYFANTRTERRWIRIRLIEQRIFDMVFSFHVIGPEFVGLMAVSAFVQFREQGIEPGGTPPPSEPICREVFQFSYKEAIPSVAKRFDSWLEATVLAGIDGWRRQL